MIVQCEACQTRFRLADEKIKPGGTKVRCSKCKEVFTVMPPEAEPAEETVEFDSFNMEKVTDDAPGAPASDPEGFEPDTSEAEHAPAAARSQDDEVDFSAFEEEAGRAGAGEELADDFSFAAGEPPAEEDASAEEPGFSFEDQPQQESTEAEHADFGAAFMETEEPGGPVEFDFGDQPDSAEAPIMDFQAEEPAAAPDFSFDDEETSEQEAPGEFAFGDEGDAGAFNFDETEEPAAATAREEESGPSEFSFDDETPFGEDSAAEWGDGTAAETTSFDFDEPSFDNEEASAKAAAGASPDDGLQFGEIDFASDSEQSASPSFPVSEDFSKATMAKQEEAEPVSQRQPSAPPARDYDDTEPLPAPPPAKKSSLSRILVLLVLLLIALGGAAGYLFMQEGSLNLNTVVRYLPFLQDYIGEAPAASPGDRIGIKIIGSSYVNGKAGQMLVIQGSAVNNHPATRSAITIKGILLDAQGKALLQQTVFCGNKLNDAALQSMPFAAIEEAMNNQFGDSLSNMNVAAGASIPFTIVFRNLPAGVANINVEVVDSKPGVR